MSLFFNADHLPEPSPEYVAWIDVMGTQASMSRSLRITANFIFKLHTAALHAPRRNVHLYPVMDGFYASSVAQADMLEFLREVFTEVAEEFNGQADNQFRFTIRGGLAYGPVVHGNSVPEAASRDLNDNPDYREQILLGMPMVQAHLSETSAPPFGIFVHESARAFAPPGEDPLHHLWWRWDNAANRATWSDLQGNLIAYLDWCAARAHRIGYSPERIEAHNKMVRQLFA